MSRTDAIAADLRSLLERGVAGAVALEEAIAEEKRLMAGWGPPAPGPTPAVVLLPSLPNDKAIYDVVRAMLGGRLPVPEFELLKAAIAKSLVPPVPGEERGKISVGLTEDDFRWAASQLDPSRHAYARIRAVDENESGGAGFEPARAAILALDGDGGFIDGSHLSKILFEAHKFHRHTGGKFDRSHPSLSSPKWNRALYKGGQEEWRRLHAAMQLDEEAALKSASVGRYQILGENHKLAGYATVRAFWDAMAVSERAHLEAFVAFVKNKGLVDEFRKIDGIPANCAPFSEGYNGTGYAAHNYHGRIAEDFVKWSKK